ncbi:MAG: SDR family NAD(P)-dependent oxidoreductase [Lentisphaeria bacterium]|nr:SDR family NAD(P)-dependent oxidoreductase [Lentisphaeria bacterium]
MKILVTGGCGFVGSNLAFHGINRGMDVTVLDNMSRCGAELNKQWLSRAGKFSLIEGDVRDRTLVDELFAKQKFDGVFHLAGQVAMTTSLQNPRYDFEVNAMGTFNILDAIRRFAPKTPILYASTNKVYGDLEQYSYIEEKTRYICPDFPNGFNENTPIDMHSPYGVSKGTADQYVLDFCRMYEMRTAVFRHSSMYGGRQFATFDQGWIEWFCQQALKTKNDRSNKFTISGNGKQVRDILHADDVVNLYYTALENIDLIKGNAFNIGGGINNSLSLLELFTILEQKLDITMNYEKLPPRQSDQRIFVADNTKISSFIPWQPRIGIDSGINEALNWTDSMEK